jgi:hypothetical protein
MIQTRQRPPTIVDGPIAPRIGPLQQVWHFVLHYLEMCAPMCVGFMVGDLLYLAVAGAFGYSEPFGELPALSVVIVTFAMTVPMVLWMRLRGMHGRAVVEMAVVMPILAAVLLALGWLGRVAMSNLVLAEHALMMPAMLIPMLLRRDVYTGAYSRIRPRSRKPTAA